MGWGGVGWASTNTWMVSLVEGVLRCGLGFMIGDYLIWGSDRRRAWGCLHALAAALVRVAALHRLLVEVEEEEEVTAGDVGDAIIHQVRGDGCGNDTPMGIHV